MASRFFDWEAIFVDDGYFDEEPSNLDKIASKDNKVKVIHKAVGDTVTARNVGLDTASGK